MSGDIDMDMLQKATTDAMACVIANKTDDSGEAADRFGEAIEEIVAMGPVAVHSALYAWSVVTLKGFEPGQGPAGPDGFWGLEVEDIRTGEVVSIDRVADPALRDAARYVACAGNEDHATMAAIVETAAMADKDGEALVTLMVHSVKLAANVAMHLHEQRGGETA